MPSSQCMSRLISDCYLAEISKSVVMVPPAGSLHPAVPAGVRQRMISFLQTLHVGANKARSFGGVGGPWEFNLRDLLRWCQLVETVTGARQAGCGTIPLACLQNGPLFWAA